MLGTWVYDLPRDHLEITKGYVGGAYLETTLELIDRLTAEGSRKDSPPRPHDEDPAKDESASAKEGLLEEPVVKPETQALEFSPELVENGTGEGVAEDVP